MHVDASEDAGEEMTVVVVGGGGGDGSKMQHAVEVLRHHAYIAPGQ